MLSGWPGTTTSMFGARAKWWRSCVTCICNPVNRKLVELPGDWEWSSFRHYLSGVEGVVEIESQWTVRRRERLGVAIRLTPRDENPHPVSPKNGETRAGHPRR